MVAKWFGRASLGLAVAGMVLALAGRASAADAPRFTVAQGQVNVQYPSGAQTPAAVDESLSSDEYVTTGSGARAEIQLGDAAMLRLADGVQVRLTSGSSGRQVQLAAGTIEVALLRSAAGTVEVDTPSVTVRAKTAGAYRITVAANGETDITARRGHVDVVTPHGTYFLEPGKTLVATGPASNPQIANATVAPYDDFDAFNQQRDDATSNALTQTSVVAPNSDYDSYYSGSWYADTGSYPPTIVVAPLCSYAPLGFGYFNYGWGFSVGYAGFAGGCPLFTTAYSPFFSPYSPFYGGYPGYLGYWPYYGYGYPYGYPYSYGYPYRYPYPYKWPLPPPPAPPPHHHRIDVRPVSPPRIASAPVHVVAPVPVHVVNPPIAHAESDHVARTVTPHVAKVTPVVKSDVPVWREMAANHSEDRSAWERFDRDRGTDYAREISTQGTQVRGNVVPQSIDQRSDFDVTPVRETTGTLPVTARGAPVSTESIPISVHSAPISARSVPISGVAAPAPVSVPHESGGAHEGSVSIPVHVSSGGRPPG